MYCAACLNYKYEVRRLISSRVTSLNQEIDMVLARQACFRHIRSCSSSMLADDESPSLLENIRPSYGIRSLGESSRSTEETSCRASHGFANPTITQLNRPR